MTYASILGVLGWIDRAKGSTLVPTTSIFLRKAAGVHAFFLFLMFCATASANAATITVNTNADGPTGTCTGNSCPTLRAAIARANGLGSVDTIVFAAGVTGTITLSSANGGQLLVTDSVTVTGPG